MNYVGKPVLPDIRIYYKVRISKAMWYIGRNREPGHQLTHTIEKKIRNELEQDKETFY